MTAPASLLQSLTVRCAAPDDEAALLALHHASFASAWTSRQWRWRFVDNPLARTAIVGAFTGAGECLAAFCGVPLPCLFAGDRAVAVRAGDVSVHPRLRSSMAGSALLLRVSHLFFRTFGGGATRLIYGYPDSGLARTIVRHCRVDVLGDVLWLVRDIGDLAGCADRTKTVDLGHTIAADIDELRPGAGAARGGTGLARDLRYLRWRYQDNPHEQYFVACCREHGGRLRGACVMRTTGPHPHTLFVNEWMVPDGDLAVARTLLAASSALARRHGHRHLVVSFSSASPDFDGFQRHHGFRVMGSAYQCVYRSYSNSIDRRFLLGHWSHSLGDLDFL